MSSANTAAAAVSADEFPHKVFVGNLSFSTTQDELKDFFSEVADVVDASIITRGPRSLGYGFVAFADEATLNKAIGALNGKELGGRTINVESARPITEESLAAKKEKAANRRLNRNRKAGNKTAEETSTGDEKPQQGRKPEGESAEDSSPRDGKRRPRRFPRKARNGGGRAADGSDAAATSGDADAAAKKEVRKPSDTVAFIGNLPFSTTDEDLSKLFADFSISSARIVVNKRSMRPKGFGFVTFSTPADQARAIAKYSAEPLTASDRELSIKAALSEAPVASENESA
ncbi:hypothetical protein EV175_006535 [Coemansia sp. RSA 1933]|nr:hypothetical protein EV175_006535 [Coemansia sp. RSA 1933]